VSLVRIVFIGFVAGSVLFLWQIIGGYVISILVGMPGFTPYRTLLEFVVVPEGDLPAQWTPVTIAGYQAMGLVLAAALESALGRRYYGVTVAVAAALIAAASVEVPQVGLVQFDENVGGLTHISKRYGLGALLISVTGVAAAAVSAVSLGWVLQFVGHQEPSVTSSPPEA
jgi:hypothetical protein